MPLDRNQIARFDASLACCLADRAFLTRFYDLFVESSPAIAEKFRGTDFQRQRRATAASLYVIVLALEQGEAATLYLNQIAKQHGRGDLDVRPEMYEAWRDCLPACAAPVADRGGPAHADQRADQAPEARRSTRIRRWTAGRFLPGAMLAESIPSSGCWAAAAWARSTARTI